tara:strand:+ start:1159 stop:2040 length:882 start_codon:yes stop_codon:yes gene_type:complete
MTEENKCAICWEEIGEKNKSVMNCGHSFHFICITTNILKSNGDQSMNCPLCRELIVDKEFEDCCVEIVQEEDDYEEEEEENHSLWSGTQMWRRDLRVRDKVLIRTYEHVLLNNMGWGGRRSIGSEHLYAQIECEVVRVAIEPHEASEGLAPFLLKPLDGRNRLQIQAYQPKQSEVHDIELSVAWPDEDGEPMGDRLGTWSDQQREQENQWQLEALQQEIKNEQIFEKEMPDLMNLVSSCFESLGCRKDLYTRSTVHSIVHKVTVDVIKAFKDEKNQKLLEVEERVFPTRTVSI